MTLQKKKPVGQVQMIEMSAGDYLKTGLTGLENTRHSDLVDKLYHKSLEIFNYVTDQGHYPEKRHLCAACVVMAGRNEQEFISTSEVSDIFNLNRGKINSLTYRLMNEAKDEFDFREPPVESYYEYYLEGLEKKDIISEEEREAFKSKFYLCSSKLEEEHKRDVHYGIHSISTKPARTIAAGFVYYIDKHFIEEETDVIYKEISWASGVTEVTIKSVTQNLEDIETLSEMDSYISNEDKNKPKYQKIQEYVKENPDYDKEELEEKFNTTRAYVLDCLK